MAGETTPPENRDCMNTIAKRLTPEQWARVAAVWTAHGQGYGTEDQFIADTLYKDTPTTGETALRFAQGQIPGEPVKADGSPK